MRAEIITIGDELLIGQIINTNVAWIGERLDAIGIEVIRTVVVGDDESDIVCALSDACRNADVVLLTGGLGPTHDDVTKKAVARFWNVDLELDQDVLAGLEAWYTSRGRQMRESSKTMAWVPVGFDVLENSVGSAPGLWYTGQIENGRCTVVVMPGVPFEMKAIMESGVLPRLSSAEGRSIVLQKTLMTAGMGESDLVLKLGDMGQLLDEGVKLAFLPSPELGVRLRITARASDEPSARSALDRLESRLRDILSDYIYGENDERLESVVGPMLAERGMTLSVAESCTGGLLGDRITNISGSSAYFRGGIIAYENSVKMRLLDVDAQILQSCGAVSEEVACAMAVGVRKKLQSSIGIALTGIAGPTGGTPEKPVGTVWIGYADAGGIISKRLQLGPDRRVNKMYATTVALNMIRLQLLKNQV